MVVVDRSGAILSVSANWCQKLGYSEPELCGKPFASIIAPDGLFGPASMPQGGPLQACSRDFCYLRKDGATLCAHNLFAPVPGSPSWLVLSEDATEKQCEEQKLLRSEWRFRSLVEHSPRILAVVHADRTIGYVNPAVGDVLGYTPADLEGWRVDDILHPDDRPDDWEWPMLMSRYGSDTAEEVRVRHKDGTWRILEIAMHNLLYHPVVAGVVVYGRDVTQQCETHRAILDFAAETDKRQAEMTGRLQQDLVQHGKKPVLRLLGEELLAQVAGMREFGELLLKTNLDPTQKECAGKIRDSAHNLASIIEQFVDDQEGGRKVSS